MVPPITRRDVIAHQSVVPWPSQVQVEQDLLLCRAMVALFDDSFLRSQIAMRGGTLLHKVHLAPPSRYSEDIDLVVVYAGRKNKRDLKLEFHGLFEHPDFSMDLFVLSPDEIQRQKHVANTLAREISEKGIVVYG